MEEGTHPVDVVLVLALTRILPHLVALVAALAQHHALSAHLVVRDVRVGQLPPGVVHVLLPWLHHVQHLLGHLLLVLVAHG